MYRRADTALAELDISRRSIQRAGIQYRRLGIEIAGAERGIAYQKRRFSGGRRKIVQLQRGCFLIVKHAVFDTDIAVCDISVEFHIDSAVAEKAAAPDIEAGRAELFILRLGSGRGERDRCRAIQCEAGLAVEKFTIVKSHTRQFTLGSGRYYSTATGDIAELGVVDAVPVAAFDFESGDRKVVQHQVVNFDPVAIIEQNAVRSVLQREVAQFNIV